MVPSLQKLLYTGEASPRQSLYGEGLRKIDKRYDRKRREDETWREGSGIWRCKQINCVQSSFCLLYIFFYF